MKIRSLFAGAATIAMTVGTAQAQGTDPKHRQFLYFLPTGSAGATVTQQIASCPQRRGDTPKIVTTIAIGGEIGPDTHQPFVLDARAGFLSKRTTKLTLHGDGTLDTFNASAEGQGGAVISSAIKVAATVAAWSVGVPVPPPAMAQAVRHGPAPRPVPPPGPAMYCTARIARAVAQLDEVRDQIDRIETASIAGGAASASTARLERLRDEEKALVATLTLRAGKGVKFDPTRAMFSAGHDDAMGLLPATAVEQWFSSRADGPPDVGHRAVFAAFPDIPGEAGFQVTLTPDRDLLTAFAGDGSQYDAAPTRAVYYRHSVPATISVAPCAPGPVTGGACTADTSPRGKLASKSDDVQLPQLSGLYSLSIGAGGLFGTSEATIAFDAGGSPTTLEYGHAAGGADIAGVIDSAATGAATLHDARLNATKRRAEEITAENDLAALLAGK